jgi:uncharacterized membrane protein YidH (DUF202 family)
MTAVDDDGLAEERTSLAWSRSSLALLACGAAVLKGVPRLPDPAGRPLAGAVILAMAAVAALVGTLEERARIRAVASGAGAIEQRVVRRVAFANSVIGVAALVLALLAS